MFKIQKVFLLFLPLFIFANSHASTLSLLDTLFIRTKGKPNEYIFNFTAPSNSLKYSLHIENGPSDYKSVSSAVIELNGGELFDQNDFNQEVEELNTEVGLQTSNVLRVSLASAPNSALRIHIYTEGDIPKPEIEIITPENGDLFNKLNPPLNVAFTDTGSGLNLSSFSVIDNGNDISSQFSISSLGAIWDTLNSISEGNHFVLVSVSDVNGEIAKDSVSFEIDVTPPSIEITSPENGLITNESIQTIFWTIDGTEFSESITLIEGTNTILKTAMDEAGNISADSIEITLDTQPPVVIISSPSDGLLTNNPLQTIEWTVDGNSYSEEVTLIEGINVITKSETDSAGNIGSDSISILVDTQPPYVKIIEPTNNFLTNEPNQTVKWIVDEDTLSENVILSEGISWIYKSSTDLAGNIGKDSVLVELDTQKPVVSIISPMDGLITNNPTQEIVWTIDGDQYSDTIGLTEGNNLIVKESTDPSGNRGADTISITLDTKPPIVSFLAPQNNLLTSNPNQTLIWIVDNDTLSESVLLVEGSNVFIKTSSDSAGNFGSDTLSISLDTKPPKISFISPQNNLLTNISTQNLIWTVDDDTLSEIVGLVEGSNKFVKSAVDIVGNEASDTLIIRLDTQPPIVSFLLPQNDFLTNQPNQTLVWVVENDTLLEDVVLEEGTNQFIKSANDSAGNIGSDSLTLVLDTKEPTVTITYPNDGYLTNQKNFVLVWEVDGVESSEPIVLAEGENTLIRSATDLAGNIGSDTVTVYLDTQSPVVIITSPSDGYITNQLQITLEWKVDDSTFSELLSLLNGINTIIKSATDSAGNSGSDTITVTLDQVPPVVEITSPADSFLTNNPNITIEWIVDSIPYSEDITLVEGENLIIKSANDVVGNNASDSIVVFLDTTPPNVRFQSPIDGYVTNNPTQIISWKVDESLFSATISLTEGTNKIVRDTIDEAGNLGADSITIILDTQIPNVEITSHSDTTITNVTLHTIEWTVDGTNYSEQISLTEGIHEIIKADTDLAGNTGADTIYFIVDLTPPNVQIISPTDGFSTQNPNQTLVWEIDGIQYSEDIVLSQGSNGYKKTATDEVGNIGSDSITIFLDVQGPVVEIISPLPNTPFSIDTIGVRWLVDGVEQFTENFERISPIDTMIIREAFNSLGYRGADTVKIRWEDQNCPQFEVPQATYAHWKFDQNGFEGNKILNKARDGRVDLAWNSDQQFESHGCYTGIQVYGRNGSTPWDDSLSIINDKKIVSYAIRFMFQIDPANGGTGSYGRHGSSLFGYYAGPKIYVGREEWINITTQDANGRAWAAVTSDRGVIADSLVWYEAILTIDARYNHDVRYYMWLDGQQIPVDLHGNPFDNGIRTNYHSNWEVGFFSRDANTFYGLISELMVVHDFYYPVNSAPFIMPHTDLIATEQIPFNIDIEAIDPEGEVIKLELIDSSYGMYFDTLTGAFNWTPTYNQVGDHHFTIRAIDEAGNYTDQEFDISVKYQEYPPVFTSSPPLTAKTGEKWVYQVTAYDVNQHPYFLRKEVGPDEMVARPNWKVEWTPTYSDSGYHTVSLKVIDVTNLTNYQTFDLYVEYVNHPPVIQSNPPLTVKEGYTWSYQMMATDINHQNLTYIIESAPTGLSVVDTTGYFEWIVPIGTSGSFPVTLSVVDRDGAKDTQTFSITVTDIDFPNIISQPKHSVYENELYIYQIELDPELSNITYSIVTAPSSAILNENSGLFTYRPTHSEIGSQNVILRAEHIDGGFMNQSFTIEVLENVTPPPEDTVILSLFFSPSNPTVDQTVLITLGATPLNLISELSIQINGEFYKLNGSNQIYYTPKTIEPIIVLASVLEIDGDVRSVFDTITATISGNDNIAPTSEITSPKFDSVIIQKVNILGTSYDDNFAYYTLSYANMADSEFVEFKYSETTVTSGILGQLDPTLMENGNYIIRLVTVDKFGNSSKNEIVVAIDGLAKVGNFTLSFTDLKIPLAGFDLEVIRTYDSRIKSKGDFGVGWRLDLKTIKLSENRVPGAGWTVDRGGIFDPWEYSSTEPHIVTVNFPNSRPQVFEVKPIPFNPILDPNNGYIELVPRAGTYSKLEMLGTNEWYRDNDTIRDFNTKPFDPNRYLLTLPNGNFYVIDQNNNGVVQIGDPNNNTITINTNGLVHSSGEQFPFSRDGNNKIYQINDSHGRRIQYSYDLEGNLVSFMDANGNVTSFTYETGNYLKDIIDPRGIQAIRTEYDDDGRMVRQINAEGDTTVYSHDLGNNTEVVKDFSGDTRTYLYDDRGNVTSETDALGNTTSHIYNHLDQLTETTLPDGNTITRSYDSQGNEVSTVDESGAITIREYNSFAKVTKHADPLGRVTVYTYDSKGNLTQTLGPDTTIQSTMTYDSQGNVLTETDALGNTTTYQYNSKGQQTKVIDALGREIESVYDGQGNVTSTTDAKDLVMTYTYDDNGNLLTSTDPLSGVTENSYTSFNKVKKVTDALGRETETLYDIFGQKNGTIRADGSRMDQTFDSEGNVKETTDPIGRITTFYYDTENRLIATKFNDGAIDSTEFDSRGRRTTKIDPLGNRTEYEYDEAGNNILVRDALGNETHFEFDLAGNKTAMIDALGHRTEYEYDAYNRQIKVIFPNSTYSTTAYDDAGRKTSETDQEGNTTQFSYDAVGNLTSVTDALGKVTSYSYDENNNQISQTDANNYTTTFEFDDLNRMVKKVYPNGDEERNGFDLVGNLLYKIAGNGDSTSYEYDVLNREIKRTYESGHTVRTTYYDDGQIDSLIDYRGVEKRTYDSRGRIASTEHPNGDYITNTYDDNSNRLTAQNPFTATTYTFDELNRMKTVTSQDGKVTTYNYDNIGRRIETVQNGGLKTEYTYDSLNRLTDVVHKNSSGSIMESYKYELNDAGIRTAVIEGNGSRVDYTYDDLYRLVGEVRTGTTPYSINYTYDDVGNRLTKVKNGISTSYAYNTRDQLLSEFDGIDSTLYSYDASGRLVSKTINSESTTYNWIDKDRMSSVSSSSGTVTYVYDSEGRRVSETSDGVTRQYLIDRSLPYGQVVLETNASGSYVSDYVYGQERISKIKNSTESYYLADGQGSVRLLSDEYGIITDTYDYEAFGETIARTGITENDFQFVGEQKDANSSFYYLRARWMDPSSGRFVSVDPYAGDPMAPISLHRYLYANQSPITLIDPTGESPLTNFLQHAKRFLPPHLITALAFGRWAHTVVQTDIKKSYPNAIPEVSVVGGRVDVMIHPFIYEIKPWGSVVSPDKQLARYVSKNPNLQLGLIPLNGLVTNPPPAFGLSISYETVRPGVIYYEAFLNREGVSLIVTSAVSLYIIRATANMLSAVALNTLSGVVF